MWSRGDEYQQRSRKRILLLVIALLCSGASTHAKDRKWISAELVSVKETQVDTEDPLYRSSQPNNTMSAPPLASGAEKRTRKVYSYSFKVEDKHYDGISEKKPVVGLSEGMQVQIVIQRGWVIVQMPHGKEKRLDLVP